MARNQDTRLNPDESNKRSWVEVAVLCKAKRRLKKEKCLEAIAEVYVCSKSTQQDEMLQC